MKHLQSFSGILITILIFLLIVVISLYGAVLAFKASIILGVLVLFIEPSPFVIGVVALFGTNVADIIQNWINFPV